VPFILINNSISKDIELRKGGTLADVSPTILHLLDRKKPAVMDGSSLLINY
jgi:2,3-bisphosphoglycerate-independent phosphoglycerate mutase